MLRVQRFWSLKRVVTPFLNSVKQSYSSQHGDDDDTTPFNSNGNRDSKVVDNDEKKEIITHEQKEKRIRIAATEPSMYDYKPVKDIMRKEYDAMIEGKDPEDILEVPRETDCAIIGGGAIGLATAYFMQLNSDAEMNVTVIEKDPSVGNLHF